MNTPTALFNLMPDSGSAGAVIKRLNASRAGVGPSGASSPPSAFDALLKQAEAQSPIASESESESSALQNGDETEVERLQHRNGPEDIDAQTTGRPAIEDMTPPRPTEAWMLQGWPSADGVTGSLAAAMTDWTSSVPQADSKEAANPLNARVDTLIPASSVGGQAAPWSEAGTPGRGANGSMEERRPIGTYGAGELTADRMPREEGTAAGALNEPTRLGEQPQASDAQAETRPADRISEAVSPGIPGAGLQPTAPARPDETAVKASPPTTPSAEALARPVTREPASSAASGAVSRTTLVGRQNAAAEYRRDRGEEATDRMEGLGVLQRGSGSGEEPRARWDGTALTGAATAPSHPSSPSSLLPNLQTAAPAWSVDTLNVSRVLEQTRAAPEGYSTARLDTPLTDDAFPRVLGLQIGRWTDEGVQQVWLDVHPADMGPVAIQIALDGRQAELNFGAESAVARQVIEASLPELASALQAAGLTLSGGSISQDMPQSRPGNDGPLQSGSRRGVASERSGMGAGNLASTRPTSTRGLVDLYA